MAALSGARGHIYVAQVGAAKAGTTTLWETIFATNETTAQHYKELCWLLKDPAKHELSTYLRRLRSNAASWQVREPPYARSRPRLKVVGFTGNRGEGVAAAARQQPPPTSVAPEEIAQKGPSLVNG